MKRLILIPILFLFALLIIPLANAQNEPLVHKLNFADSSTISSTFETLDTIKTFNINKTTDITAVVTLSSGIENSGGGDGDIREAEWRMLIDGNQISDNINVDVMSITNLQT